MTCARQASAAHRAGIRDRLWLRTVLRAAVRSLGVVLGLLRVLGWVGLFVSLSVLLAPPSSFKQQELVLNEMVEAVSSLALHKEFNDHLVRSHVPG